MSASSASATSSQSAERISSISSERFSDFAARTSAACWAPRRSRSSKAQIRSSACPALSETDSSSAVSTASKGWS